LKISSQELGRRGEKLAADFLSKQGYSILARNVHTPYGELDLVAEHLIVFVEVKSRRSQSFGYPEDSITANKREHLISAAQHFLQEHPGLGDDWRIDVIAIEIYKNRAPIINHFENAIHE
jgi:putative endonuclease